MTRGCSLDQLSNFSSQRARIKARYLGRALLPLARAIGSNRHGVVESVNLRAELLRLRRYLDTFADTVTIVVQHLLPVAKADHT